MSSKSAAVLNMERMGDIAVQRKQVQLAAPTKAEATFRGLLKALRINHQFQRIVYTERRFFILDFVLFGNPRLIVEIDGSCHDLRATYDRQRTDLILKTTTYSSRHWKLERLTNKQVFNGEALEFLKRTYPKQWRRWGCTQILKEWKEFNANTHR